MLPRRLTISIAVGVAVVAVAVGAYGIDSASSGGSAGASAGQAARTAANARSGPAAGGASGTVAGRSTSGFTLSTSAGEKVTVHETSSTRYEKGTSSTTANAVTTGTPVLALGTVGGTTITATQVIVQPTGSGPAGSAAAKVIPFKRGAPTTSKQVGRIPADYGQGSGTVVSGTTADKATEAALAAYPGGIVDRVVRLSNGDYEVHNIGVNWPHHIFVDKDVKVIGAD